MASIIFWMENFLASFQSNERPYKFQLVKNAYKGKFYPKEAVVFYSLSKNLWTSISPEFFLTN